MAVRSLRAAHWNEAKHPRDDRGRFSRKGGGKWVAKVAREVQAKFGDISMGAHPDHQPQGRLQTGKGHVIDTRAIARTAPLGVHGPAEAPGGRVGRTPTGTFVHGSKSATSSHPANAVATLNAGDHARVQGVDQYGKQMTLNGHVQGVGKVKMGKRGSRTKQDMLAVSMAETPSGANGWRGTVYVKPDATAERTAPKPETTAAGAVVGNTGLDTPRVGRQAGGVTAPDTRRAGTDATGKERGALARTAGGVMSPEAAARHNAAAMALQEDRTGPTPEVLAARLRRHGLEKIAKDVEAGRYRKAETALHQETTSGRLARATFEKRNDARGIYNDLTRMPEKSDGENLDGMTVVKSGGGNWAVRGNEADRQATSGYLYESKTKADALDWARTTAAQRRAMRAGDFGEAERLDRERRAALVGGEGRAYRPQGSVAMVSANTAKERAKTLQQAPQLSDRSKQVYDKLLGTGGAPGMIKNKGARNIVEQLEAHGWEVGDSGGYAQYGVVNFVHPDGRTLGTQHLDVGPGANVKPRLFVRNRDLTQKAALALAVTPVHEEVGGPSVSRALERIGAPASVDKAIGHRMGIGSGVSDDTIEPLHRATRALSGYGGASQKSHTEVAADLRRAAEDNRRIADHRAEYNRGIMSGNGEDANTALRRQRADQFEGVANELEKMHAERQAYETERDRRAALPLDIRPGRTPQKLPRPSRTNTGKQASNADGGNTPSRYGKLSDERIQQGLEMRGSTDAELVAEAKRRGIPVNPPSDALARETAPGDLEARIRAAHAELVQPGTPYVSLHNLRSRFPDVSRKEFDAALERLNKSPDINLEPEPNQKILTDERRAGALHLGGEDRHLLGIIAPPERRGRTAAGPTPPPSAAEDDLTGTVNLLKRPSTTREEAHAELEDLTGDELREVARRLNVRRDGVRNKEEMRRRIVEYSVGRRSDSEAIGRTALGPRPGGRSEGVGEPGSGFTEPPRVGRTASGEQATTPRPNLRTNEFGFPQTEGPARPPQSLEDRRAASLATRDGIPPKDGRPDITALATSNSKNDYHRWSLSTSKGRDATMAPDVARVSGGVLDGKPAQAVIMNPKDGTGDYRYRITDENTGAVLEEGSGRDAGEVFAKADRIFSSQRGQGAARTAGNEVHYAARSKQRDRDRSRGDFGPGPFYDFTVVQVDRNGNEKEVVKTNSMDRAQAQAAEMNAKEAGATERAATALQASRNAPGMADVYKQHRDLTREQFDALPADQQEKVLNDLRKVRDSKEQISHTIPSNRTTMGTTIRGTKNAPWVDGAQAKLRELTYTAPPPVDNSIEGLAARLKAGQLGSFYGTGLTKDKLNAISMAAGYGGFPGNWQLSKIHDYLRARVAAGDEYTGSGGLAGALGRAKTREQAHAMLQASELSNGITMAEMKALAPRFGGSKLKGDKRQHMADLAALVGAANAPGGSHGRNSERHVGVPDNPTPPTRTNTGDAEAMRQASDARATERNRALLATVDDLTPAQIEAMSHSRRDSMMRELRTLAEVGSGDDAQRAREALRRLETAGKAEAGATPAAEASSVRNITSGGKLQPNVTGENAAALTAASKAAGRSLPPGQRKALDQWTSGKGMVRKIQTGKVSAETADNFDAAMRAMPKVDGLVYRAVNPSGESAAFHAGLNPGDVIELGGPASVSIDPRKAGAFGTNLYEIETPSAAYLGGVGSDYAYEKEGVLPPGHFEVVGTETATMGLGKHTAQVSVTRLRDVSQGERSWKPTTGKDFSPVDTTRVTRDTGGMTPEQQHGNLGKAEAEATSAAGPVPKVTGYAKGRELEPGMLVNAADLLPMHESQGNTTGENPNPSGHANWVRVGLIGNTNSPAYQSYNSNRSLTGGMYVVFDQSGHPVGRMSANTITEINTENVRPEAALQQLRVPIKVQVKVNDGFGKSHMEERDSFGLALVPSRFARDEAGMPAPKMLGDGILDPADPHYAPSGTRPLPSRQPHGGFKQGSRTREQYKADRQKRDEAYAASEPQRAARRAELEARRKADAAAQREQDRVEAEKAYEIRREQDRRDRITRRHEHYLETLAATDARIYDTGAHGRPVTGEEKLRDDFRRDSEASVKHDAQLYGVKTLGKNVTKQSMIDGIVAALKDGKQPDYERHAPKAPQEGDEAKKIAAADKRRRNAITKDFEELRTRIRLDDTKPEVNFRGRPDSRAAFHYRLVMSEAQIRQLAEAYELQGLSGTALMEAIFEAIRSGRAPDLDAHPVTSLKKKR